MPLDPSIFSQIGQGVTPIQSPIDSYAKLQQIQHLGIQNQVGQLQVGQMQRDQDMENQTRAYMAQSGGDLDKATELAASAGNYKAVQTLTAARQKQQLGDLEMQRALASMDDEKRKRIKDWNAQSAQIWSTAKDEPSYQMAKASIRKLAVENGVQVPQGYDPHPAQYDPNFVQLEMAKGTSIEQQIRMIELQKAHGFHAAVGPDGKPGIFQVTPQGKAVQIQGVKPLRAASGGGNGVATVPMRSESVDDIKLAFIQGRRTWPTGRELKEPEIMAGWKAALREDPTLNQSTAKLRESAQKDANTGKLGISNNAIMTVIGHIGHLKNAYEQLPDLRMGKLANKISGTLSEWSPGGNPILQEVNDLTEGIAPEMSKVYVSGAGTMEERKGWKERINPFRPIPERKSNLYAFGSMLITKLNQNEAQYRKSFTGLSESVVPPPIQLTEDAYQALKEIQTYTGKKIPGADKWIQRYEGSANPTGAPMPNYNPTRSTTKYSAPTETKVNPANGKTYYRHSDGKFYLEPPK